MEAFWSAFWPALVATLIGTFVGVSLALWLGRRQERRSRIQEEISLLRAARQAILHNLKLCNQVADILESLESIRAHPTFRMDPVTLNYVGPRLLQIMDDEDLARRIENFRYQVASHLDPQLARLVEWIPRGDETSGTNVEMIKELRGSISSRAELLLAEYYLLERIDDRIKKLESTLHEEGALPD